MKNFAVVAFLALFAFHADAMARNKTSMVIVVGQECACGNHSGGCDAQYKNKKIELAWSMANSSVQILCPKDGTYGASPISGLQIEINGEWVDKEKYGTSDKVFEVHRIIATQ
jgi:hypothetical protein